MKNEKPEKAKVVMTFNMYGGVVLDADKALQFMELMRGLERYQSKYHADKQTSTVHIYPPEPDSFSCTFQYLTDEQYALGRIAGKPKE